jgi:hypothetical protein
MTYLQKGWPAPTIEEVKDFYSKYGKVLSVRLRRNAEKKLKVF